MNHTFIDPTLQGKRKCTNQKKGLFNELLRDPKVLKNDFDNAVFTLLSHFTYNDTARALNLPYPSHDHRPKSHFQTAPIHARPVSGAPSNQPKSKKPSSHTAQRQSHLTFRLPARSGSTPLARHQSTRSPQATKTAWSSTFTFVRTVLSEKGPQNSKKNRSLR